MLTHWDSLNVMVFLNSFNFVLLSDVDVKTGDVDEITFLTCDNIAVSIVQSDVSTLLYVMLRSVLVYEMVEARLQILRRMF